MKQRQVSFVQESEQGHDFGTLLKVLRVSKQVRQITIVALLPGWSRTSYTRLENGELPPHFDQLYALYRAFHLAGISFTLEARQQFLDFARRQIEKKKTYLDKHSDSEWAELRYQLARLDGSASTPAEEQTLQKSSVVNRPLLAETSHLLGREGWHEHLLSLLNTNEPKKLLLVRGPAGIGKSSEVNWLATYLFRQRQTSYRVILCDFRSLERGGGPEEAFEVFLGTLLTELGYVQPQTMLPSWEERTVLVLEQLEKGARPTVILLDHCECILQPSGLLAACWERFLTKFLRSKHLTTLVLATKQWPGWYEGEQQFVAEIPLPPLSAEKGVLVLQQLGLEHIPVSLLQDIYQRTGGIPLGLEWVAALVKQPLFADDWEEFTTLAQDDERESHRTMIDAIQRLLQEPHLFGGSVADELAPFLERILSTQRLSSEANALLQTLAVATLPLAKPALQVLCPLGSRPLKELRRASVLVAYPDRAQLLPMVAAAMYRRLSSEQVYVQETLLLQAYKVWQQDEAFHEQEEGKLIAEYATLLLKHRHFLDAAQFLITYGWASVNLGYGPRLTRLIVDMMRGNEWHATIEQKCGGLLLRAFYAPFSDIPSDLEQSTREYQYVLDAILAEKITVRPWIETHVVHSLMYCAIREERFADGLAILDSQQQRLKTHYSLDINAHMFLQEKYALLFCKWGEYAHIQGEIKRAKELRMHAIDIYRTCIAFLTEQDQASPAKDFKRRLARCFNGIGYHLNYLGFYEDALLAIEQSIALKVQGYTTLTGLAESYGEKSQVLAALGKFQEALYFDEQAMLEIQRVADTGHSSSREDIWIYRVNRGVLYLRLGRVEEAEQLLREATLHIQAGRRIYQVFAEDALNEIKEWRQEETENPHYQLDRRWVERFRELASYDGHGWLAFGGPFTPEEQEQWNHLFTPPVDAGTWVQLAALLKQSRERELAEALSEQREPHLRYPAIDIVDVRQRMISLRHLDDEIQHQEPNAIVRRLYRGAIEEEIDFLSLIEATYEGDSEKYWACNLRLFPLPTHEEMEEVLAHIRHEVQQGLQRPETVELSQSLLAFMQTQFHLSLDLSPLDEEAYQRERLNVSSSTSQPKQREVSAQTAQAFFASILQESGYKHWRVVIDPSTSNFRVERGMRQLFLPDRTYTVAEIRKAFIHELAGHAARCLAGDHSHLGLLGINTKNALLTEEGFILYHERRIAASEGQTRDISGILMSTFMIGLVTGVMTPPQTFLPICTFVESFSLLRRLLNHPEAPRERLERLAKEYAITVSLRTFRGVPNLQQAGICYLKDTVYLHGLHMIERAVSQDETVLDRLAVGVIALELLPDLQELGIPSAPASLWELAERSDLDDYILSFEEPEKDAENKV